MKKEDQLAGIAQNLAENFISKNNMPFLEYIASLPQQRVGFIQINLLSEEVIPKEIKGSLMKQTISQHKKWLLGELKQRELKKQDVKEARIEFSCTVAKLMRKKYICHVTIVAFGKEFREESMEMYS